MSSQATKDYHKKDFWSIENQKYRSPHFRLKKSARIVNEIAGARPCTLLDIGCGPGTLSRLLAQNIQYYGIDISIPEPAHNLHEFDILEQPIEFEGRRFDLVVAQGLFEYLGDHQVKKFEEIAHVLQRGGTFLTSYVNFAHRNHSIYEVYNNVQPTNAFRESLSRFFTIERCFPTSHNWRHDEPRRPLLQRANMNLDVNVPFLSRKLAVEYFYVCSPRNASLPAFQTDTRR